MTSEQSDSTNLADEFQKSSLENTELSNEEKVVKADKFKEEGNNEFKSKNFVTKKKNT